MMSDLLLAYAFGRRDPTAIFHLLMLWAAVQAIVWLVGRDSLENDGWRSFALAVLATVIPRLVYSLGSAAGAQGLISAAILAGLAVWIVGGLLYEPSLRQRIVLTVASVAMSALLFPVAAWLRDWLIPAVAGT